MFYRIIYASEWQMFHIKQTLLMILVVIYMFVSTVFLNAPKSDSMRTEVRKWRYSVRQNVDVT